MISIRYPSVLETVRQLTYGLCPVWLRPEGRFSLMIKAPKEVILTAQLRKEIRIYLVPDAAKAGHAHGLMTCFFDDHDVPLFLASPLFAVNRRRTLTPDRTAILTPSVRDRLAGHDRSCGA